VLRFCKHDAGGGQRHGHHESRVLPSLLTALAMDDQLFLGASGSGSDATTDGVIESEYQDDEVHADGSSMSLPGIAGDVEVSLDEHFSYVIAWLALHAYHFTMF